MAEQSSKSGCDLSSQSALDSSSQLGAPEAAAGDVCASASQGGAHEHNAESHGSGDTDHIGHGDHGHCDCTESHSNTDADHAGHGGNCDCTKSHSNTESGESQGPCDGSHCHCHSAETADEDEDCGGGCCGGCGCSEAESTAEEDTAWLEEHAPAVDTPTPEAIVELVVACVQFVKDALDIELDFTPETLPILDHYLLLARQSLTERPELRELIWRFAGAYFGELVRRRFNGFWHLPSLDVHTWRLQQRQVLLSFNPVGVVAEALAGSESSEAPTGALRLAHADQPRVAERLAVIPPLPEDQYFLLSTRLEVIETIIEHLRVCMSENDQADIEFDPDDYSNDLLPYGAA